MIHRAAVPFNLRRSEDVVSLSMVTSTTEVVHGLLRLDGERLVIQWRLSRQTESVGGASYLRAFEEVAGAEGLKLAHPAEIVLRLRRGDVLVAVEFVAELTLALAERTLLPGPTDPRLPPGRSQGEA